MPQSGAVIGPATSIFGPSCRLIGWGPIFSTWLTKGLIGTVHLVWAQSYVDSVLTPIVVCVDGTRRRGPIGATGSTLVFACVVSLECRSRMQAPRAQDASWTRGIFQLPSRIEGFFSFGQYIRIISTKRPAGAGSQFASFAFPGDSCWM